MIFVLLVRIMMCGVCFLRASDLICSLKKQSVYREQK